MILKNITVSEETTALCNINAMVSKLRGALNEYHEKFDKQNEDEEFLEILDEIMEPAETYVKNAIIRSVDHNTTLLGYTL